MIGFALKRCDASQFVRSALWATMLAVCLCMSLPAFAGLGEEASSVDADQAHMQGERRTTPAAAYSIHEITAATGIRVREYVSSFGQVFGVAWQGPWPPDMRQILANYFETYRQAAQTQANSHTGRKPLVIRQPEFVLHSGGHMRSFNGRAYVPSLLPSGVTPESIQ